MKWLELVIQRKLRDSGVLSIKRFPRSGYLFQLTKQKIPHREGRGHSYLSTTFSPINQTYLP
jgi:hypothetical protein